MVPSKFTLDPPLFDLMECLVDHETLSTCYHVGHHVDFSSIQVSLVPHSLIYSELELPPTS